MIFLILNNPPFLCTRTTNRSIMIAIQKDMTSTRVSTTQLSTDEFQAVSITLLEFTTARNQIGIQDQDISNHGFFNRRNPILDAKNKCLYTVYVQHGNAYQKWNVPLLEATHLITDGKLDYVKLCMNKLSVMRRKTDYEMAAKHICHYLNRFIINGSVELNMCASTVNTIQDTIRCLKNVVLDEKKLNEFFRAHNKAAVLSPFTLYLHKENDEFQLSTFNKWITPLDTNAASVIGTTTNWYEGREYVKKNIDITDLQLQHPLWKAITTTSTFYYCYPKKSCRLVNLMTWLSTEDCFRIQNVLQKVSNPSKQLMCVQTILIEAISCKLEGDYELQFSLQNLAIVLLGDIGNYYKSNITVTGNR